MDSKSVDINAFLSYNKSMIIAPAGHGKTHTIVDCLEGFIYKGKKMLILTHTHAGIASLKEKIKKRNILPNKYEISTICSFMLDLAKNYVNHAFFSDHSDVDALYKTAYFFCGKLIKAHPIREVLRARYDHIIVDEYQDCSVDQNKLIDSLSSILKVHILGDPMQGIFDFRGEAVDLNGDSLAQYRENLQTLSIPWRWINTGNVILGEELKQIRTLLENQKEINLTQFHSIKFVSAKKEDFYSDRNSAIRKIIRTLLHDDNTSDVLIIHPHSFRKESRIRLLKFIHKLRMIESIDDKDYYKWADEFDCRKGEGLVVAVVGFLKETCNASHLDSWIRKDGTIVKKRNDQEIFMMKELRFYLENLFRENNAQNIISFITFLQTKFNCRIIRADLFYSILTVLKQAAEYNISFKESLRINRDKVRRVGRKIDGKVMGTTLLTKGLECDTVLVLEAEKFDSPKDLYVALSRCSHRLIVSATSPILHPYPKAKSEPRETLKKKEPRSIQLSLFN